MSERGIHYVEADLDATWLRDWMAVGLLELEEYLGKHAAFVEFLRNRAPGAASRQLRA
jgi:hypothetical protein